MAMRLRLPRNSRPPLLILRCSRHHLLDNHHNNNSHWPFHLILFQCSNTSFSLHSQSFFLNSPPMTSRVQPLLGPGRFSSTTDPTRFLPGLTRLGSGQMRTLNVMQESIKCHLL